MLVDAVQIGRLVRFLFLFWADAVADLSRFDLVVLFDEEIVDVELVVAQFETTI
jgi:hypothetical protein